MHIPVDPKYPYPIECIAIAIALAWSSFRHIFFLAFIFSLSSIVESVLKLDRTLASYKWGLISSSLMPLAGVMATSVI